MVNSNIKSTEITQNVGKIGRPELLNISSYIVENLKGRISQARFKASDTDPIKLQYYRVLIQAVQIHNTILRDEELEDIKTRLEALEAMK